MAEQFALVVRNASLMCHDFEGKVAHLGDYDGESLVLAIAFGLCPSVFPLVASDERERCISHLLWGMPLVAADIGESLIPVKEVPRRKAGDFSDAGQST